MNAVRLLPNKATTRLPPTKATTRLPPTKATTRLPPTAALSAARSLATVALSTTLLGLAFLALPWTRHDVGSATIVRIGFGAAPVAGTLAAVGAALALAGVRVGLSWRPGPAATSPRLIALAWTGAVLAAGAACAWASRLGPLVVAHDLGPGGIFAMTAEMAAFLLAAVTASALRHARRPAVAPSKPDLDATHERIVTALTD